MAKRGIPIKNDYFQLALPKFTEIENMLMYGYSTKDIAQYLGITIRTLYKWKNTYTEFEMLFASVRQKQIHNLRKSLYMESKGYEHTEVHTEEIIDPDTGEVKFRKIKKVKKYHRANSSLLIFALCNWVPDEFKRTDTEEIIKSLQVFMSKDVENTYGD